MKLFMWFIWLAVVIGVLWLIVYQTRAANRPHPTQGMGAAALLKGIKQTGPPALPKMVAPLTPRTLYFAATAVNACTNSGYSKEVSVTNAPPITLAWDANDPVDEVTNYLVWIGTNSGTYFRSFDAGTNLILQVPPPPSSNVVVTISGSINWTATNPTASMMLFTGKNLTISKRYQ